MKLKVRVFLRGCNVAMSKIIKTSREIMKHSF